MASYNSIPHLNNGQTANTADALGLNAAGQPMNMGMGMGMGDPFSFDETLLDVNTGLDFTPSAYDFDNFTFEDPFSTTTSYPPLPVAHSQVHTHSHHGSHTAYNLPAVGGPSSHINVGPIAAEAEAALNKITTHEVDSPSDILDNKLLGFSPPIPSGQATLVDSETGRFADLNMTAELYGMFFVAEDVFASNTPGDPGTAQGGQGQTQGQGMGPRPLELTCYRRNLWQCTGQITLPRHALHCSLLVNDDKANTEGGGGGGGGRQVQIKELWASITALESIEGKQTEIISIPWKSSNPAALSTAAGGNGGQQGQQQEEPSKTATTPPKQLLDLASGQEIDGDGNRVSIPVAWKRLQFKHATANNGRRKGLQQHYVVQINLLAKTVEETGDKLIKLAEIQSGPVIVRGRSPRNFDSRRDVPLTGERKGMLQRTSTEGSVGNGNGNGKQQQQGQSQQELLQRFQSLPGNQPQDWSSTTPTPQPFSTSPNPQQHQQHPNKKLAMSCSSSVSPNPGSRPPIPSWGSSSSDLNNGGSRRNNNNNLTPSAQYRGHHRSKSSTASIPSIPLPTAGSMPISLSLLDDDQQRSPPLNRTSSGSGGENMKSPLYPKSGHVKKESISSGRGMVGLGLGLGMGSLAGSGQGMDLDLDLDLGETKLREQKEQKEKESLGSPSLETTAADLLYEYFPLSLDDWLVFFLLFCFYLTVPLPLSSALPTFLSL
ncbi:hypothetical protein B0T20DRAFT_135857 [Sordaria brevicollis]|uniref:NDT80 domain-containing protein n=1 Tax=Sordaria brevicollis TaxID=83679 RepID=A0AAE0PLS9_SORBR|nr:hypothetical protein B0T20DRAFT_135857 [Sordaria brevicollis]